MSFRRSPISEARFLFVQPPDMFLPIMTVTMEHAPREARQAGGFTGGIATLAEGKLYALQNPYKLDGRVSSYPGSARGWSVANCYLLSSPTPRC